VVAGRKQHALALCQQVPDEFGVLEPDARGEFWRVDAEAVHDLSHQLPKVAVVIGDEGLPLARVHFGEATLEVARQNAAAPSNQPQDGDRGRGDAVQDRQGQP